MTMFKTLYKANNASGIVESRTPTSQADAATLIGNGWKEIPPPDPGEMPAPVAQVFSPLLGAIVFYRLSLDDAREITRRRSLVHYAGGNVAQDGDVYPMLITSVRPGSDPSVNGKVMLDGTDSFWVVDVREGDAVRTFGRKPTAAKPATETYPFHMHKGTGDTYESRVVGNPVDEKAAKAEGFTRDVPLTKAQHAAIKSAGKTPKSTRTPAPKAKAKKKARKAKKPAPTVANEG